MQIASAKSSRAGQTSRRTFAGDERDELADALLHALLGLFCDFRVFRQSILHYSSNWREITYISIGLSKLIGASLGVLIWTRRRPRMARHDGKLSYWPRQEMGPRTGEKGVCRSSSLRWQKRPVRCAACHGVAPSPLHSHKRTGSRSISLLLPSWEADARPRRVHGV
jgi:hypothetical protein